ARDGLRQEQLVVVTQAGHEPSLRLQAAVVHGTELLEDFDDAQEFLPVRVAERVERLAPLSEALLEPLEVTRGVLAARGGAPATAVALDRGQRGLRPLLTLARDQIRHGELAGLVREMTQSAVLAATRVARHVQRRGGPEDALHEPALETDHGAMGQERVEQRAVTADRVHAENHRQARRALAADERQASRLGLGRRALAAAAATSRGLAPRFDLRPRAAIAADAREVAARRLVDTRALERILQRAHFRFHLSNPLEVLVLAERRLDPLAQQFGRRASAEQQRGRAIAELELALDRLRRPVHHP